MTNNNKCEIPALKRFVEKSGDLELISEYNYAVEQCKYIEESDYDSRESIDIFNQCITKLEEDLDDEYERAYGEETIRRIKDLDLSDLSSDYQTAALMSNLINWMAKIEDSEYYYCKPAFVKLASNLAPDNKSGIKDGVAYVDTDVGQVSFHLFDEIYDDMDEDIINQEIDWEYEKEWSGIPTQEHSFELLDEYLEKKDEKKHLFTIPELKERERIQIT